MDLEAHGSAINQQKIMDAITRGHTKLWSMVMFQALADLATVSYRPKMIAWFREKKETPGSFRWICAAIDRDPDRILKKVMTIKIRKIKASTKLTDWDLIRSQVNQHNGYQFTSCYDMLSELYEKYQSSGAMAPIMRLSKTTIYTKMAEIGVNFGQQGKHSIYLAKIQRITGTADRTVREIAKAVGMSKGGARYLLKTYRIPYRVCDYPGHQP